MEYIVNIAVGECEDVFEVTELLRPISQIDKIRMVSVMPRPTPPNPGLAGVLPGPPQGAPGRAIAGGAAMMPTPSVSPAAPPPPSG